MSKKFYIQFVGEDKYWQNSFIQEDNISLEEFRANILLGDTIIIESDGYENIPNGWRTIPKRRICETSNVLSIYEDVDYQKNEDEQSERDETQRLTIKSFVSKYNAITGIKKKWIDFLLFFNTYDPWLDIEDNLGHHNPEYILELESKIFKCTKSVEY